MFGSDVRERSTEIGQQLADLCSDLDPNTVPLTDTPAVFDQLVTIKKLAEGAVVRMTARYEEAGRWKASGTKDFEDDLARKTGTSRGKAKATAKTSRRLKERPKTDAAVRDGKLSLEQADAVASGAEASPEDEDDLLESAGRDPVHELKKKAAKARAKADKDRDATRRRQHKLRSYRQWTDDDGMSNHLLRLPPDRGAEVDAKLAGDIDRAFSDARSAGRLESRDAYAADVVFDLLTGRRTSRYTEHRQGDTAEPGTPSNNDDYRASPGTSDGRDASSTERAPSQSGDRSNGGAVASSTATASLFPDLDGTDSHVDFGARWETSDPDAAPTDLKTPGDDARPDPPPKADTGPPAAGTEPPPADGAGPPRQTSDPPPYDGQRLPARKANEAVRPERKVIVHIDIEALNRGAILPGERCDIAGVGPVPVSVVQSMLADAFVALVIKDGQDIVNVTHFGRQVTAYQRTALEARGYKCEVEGCGSTHHLEIDHITGWTLTEITTLEDLAWLCQHHHDRKTLEDLILIGPPGQRRLVPRESAVA